MAAKYESKMRKALGQLATSFLLFHLYREDRDQWQDFYQASTQSFLKGTDVHTRRKMRLSLAPYMDMRIKTANRGRTQYICRITERNLAAMIEKFGAIPDRQGRPFEVKVEEQVDRSGLTALNPDAFSKLDNCYERGQELERRRQKAAQAQKDCEREEKERQKELNREMLRKLKEGTLLSGVTGEQQAEEVKI